MQLGQVIGNATATVKHPSLGGAKLLVVVPLMADGSADGDPLLVVDAVGAGKGEEVVITSDGLRASELMGREDSPVRWTTIGIRD
jgi:ethanolamine utilization protein EutN